MPSSLKLPGKGVIVLGRCSGTKKAFGIRFENRSQVWTLHWSFVIGEKEASGNKGKSSKATTKMSGLFGIDPSFRGCPHCPNQQMLFCDCGNALCWNGTSKTLTCYSCNALCNLSPNAVTSISGGAGR